MNRSRAQIFDSLYRADPDPWRFETSPYEREKYAATMAALPERRYGRALEVGCSIGVFTGQLARRCATVLAVDVSEAALALARRRLGKSANVVIQRAEVPRQWPAGTYDLILLSEILYFLEPAEVEGCAHRALAGLSPDGTIALVNWLGPCETTLTGEEATTLFLRTVVAAGGETECVRREANFRIDLAHRAAAPDRL